MQRLYHKINKVYFESKKLALLLSGIIPESYGFEICNCGNLSKGLLHRMQLKMTDSI